MLLELQGVTKRFGGLTAVNDVSIGVKAGEIYGLIGPNGAGKTTLLNCISGFYTPESGRILFQGRDIAGKQQYDLCHMPCGKKRS